MSAFRCGTNTNTEEDEGQVSCLFLGPVQIVGDNMQGGQTRMSVTSEDQRRFDLTAWWTLTIVLPRKIRRTTTAHKVVSLLVIVWWLLALPTIDVGGDDEDGDGDDVADDDDHKVVVEGLLGPLTIDQTLDTPTGLAPRINTLYPPDNVLPVFINTLYSPDNVLTVFINTLYPPDNGPSCSREV